MIIVVVDVMFVWLFGVKVIMVLESCGWVRVVLELIRVMVVRIG